MALIRRVLDLGAADLHYETSTDAEHWVRVSESPLGYASPFRVGWEAERAIDQGVPDGAPALPFEPLSFRDFMLFEGHYLGAARGYVERFRPVVSRLGRAYERITRRTFPALEPPALWDREPIYYMSNARTFVASGVPVPVPRYSTALDWELELGFVLNAPLHNASPAEAEDAIGAFVVLNDFSARDVQIPEQKSGFGPQKAKHFMSSLSSTAVPAEDVLHRWTDLRATVTLNGEVVAVPDPSTPRWSLGEVLAHASDSEQLLPGELFGTGTLVRGSGMEISTWLQPGDRLRLEIADVGSLEHEIISPT